MLALLGFATQVCVFLSIAAIVISCASSLQSVLVVDSAVSDATLSDTASSHYPKVMTSPAITTTISEFEVYPADIAALTVKQLKAYAKASGFTGYSALRKAELVALLSEF